MLADHRQGRCQEDAGQCREPERAAQSGSPWKTAFGKPGDRNDERAHGQHVEADVNKVVAWVPVDQHVHDLSLLVCAPAMSCRMRRASSLEMPRPSMSASTSPSAEPANAASTRRWTTLPRVAARGVVAAYR